MSRYTSDLARRIGAWWADYFRVIKSCIRGIGNDNVTILASGLVYSTLIALIPCVTFLVVFLSTFGVLQTFIDFMTTLLSELIGLENAENIISMISSYSNNAMSLGVFGLVSFLITGMFLVNKIYTVINQIFKTRPETGLIKRYITFFIFLIVFTFLIAMSIALSTTLKVRVEARLGGAVSSISWPRRLGGFLLLWATLLCFLLVVPNARVRFRSASVGATTGIIALSIASLVFANVIRYFVSYSVIYGTLASILFVLLFLYIVWYIIIIIAEITYIHQYRPDKKTLLGRPQTPLKIISEAVTLVLAISMKYVKGEGASNSRELSKRLAIPNSRLSSYLRDMEDAGIIMATNTQGTSYVPARPLNQISIKRIIEVMFGAEDIDPKYIDTIGDAVAMEFYSGGSAGMKDLNIEELLERI